MFFSIIVPVYKVEKYLDECVKSVLSQTFSDYECILIDDGSPDNCPAMCDEYAKKHEKIKVIHKENGGLSDARNIGIQAAVGEYIVLLDSDDKFADSNSLQNLFDVVQKYKTDVVVNVNWFEFTDNGEQKLIDRYDRYDRNIVYSSPLNITDGFDKASMYMGGCFFVLNREHLIKSNLFFKKGILHEDEHWMPRVLFSTTQIAVNHSPFYAYRKGREGSICTTASPKAFFDRLSIIDDLFEWSEDESTYGREGCCFMLTYAKRKCYSVLFESKPIKKRYKKEYGNICLGLQKRIRRIPDLYSDKRLLATAVLGVKITNFLLKKI